MIKEDKKLTNVIFYRKEFFRCIISRSQGAGAVEICECSRRPLMLRCLCYIQVAPIMVILLLLANPQIGRRRTIVKSRNTSTMDPLPRLMHEKLA